MVNRLRDLRRHAAELADASPLGEDEYFYADRNAELARNAEQCFGVHRSRYSMSACMDVSRL
jgi:hypothetical protein